MSYEIELREVAAQPMAAVVAVTERRDLSRTFIGGLDKVYALLRGRGATGLGHNVGLYRGAGVGRIQVTSGVQTPAAISPEGEVQALATPAGRAAATTHWGPYDRLGQAHAAIEAWRAERKLASSLNWEVYGDWSNDPAQLRTDVYHLIDEEPGA